MFLFFLSFLHSNFGREKKIYLCIFLPNREAVEKMLQEAYNKVEKEKEEMRVHVIDSDSEDALSHCSPPMSPSMSDEGGWNIVHYMHSTPKSDISEASTKLFSDEEEPTPYSVEEGPQAQPELLDV